MLPSGSRLEAQGFAESSMHGQTHRLPIGRNPLNRGNQWRNRKTRAPVQGQTEFGIITMSGGFAHVMRHLSNKRLLVVVLLIAMCAEAAWLLWPRNLLADPYRFPERQQAMGECGRQRTPESKAVWDRERQLLYDHQERIALFVIAALVVGGVVVTLIVRRSILSRHANVA
jgi:hypothetical protein